MSEDDLDFGALVPDKGKGKAHKSFEVEAESLAPKDLEASMRKDAEYVSGLFGADVSIPLSSRIQSISIRVGTMHCLLTLSDFLFLCYTMVGRRCRCR